MKYQNWVHIANERIDAIEAKDGPKTEHDDFLLRLARRYQGLMASATSEYEARIAISTLGRWWADSGAWDS